MDQRQKLFERLNGSNSKKTINTNPPPRPSNTPVLPVNGFSAPIRPQPVEESNSSRTPSNALSAADLLRQRLAGNSKVIRSDDKVIRTTPDNRFPANARQGDNLLQPTAADLLRQRLASTKDVKSLSKDEMMNTYEEDDKGSVADSVSGKELLKQRLMPIKRRDDPSMRRDDPLTRRDDPLMRRDDPLMRRDDPLMSRDDPLMSRDDPLMSRDDPLMRRDDPPREKCITHVYQYLNDETSSNDGDDTSSNEGHDETDTNMEVEPTFEDEDNVIIHVDVDHSHIIQPKCRNAGIPIAPLMVPIRYDIGCKFRVPDDHHTWTKRLSMQTIKQTFNPSKLNDVLDAEDQQLSETIEDPIRVQALSNLGFLTDPKFDVLDTKVKESKIKLVDKEIKMIETEQECSTFCIQAMQNCKIRDEQLNDKHKSYDEKMEIRSKIVKEAKRLAKEQAKKSPKKQDTFIASNIAKAVKKVSDADQTIITALASVSTKELTSLAKIGTYTIRLVDKELVRSALIACWPRLPSDDILMKNVYLEIVQRAPITDSDGRIGKTIEEFGSKAFSRISRTKFALEHRADIMEPFSPLVLPEFKWDPFQLKALSCIRAGISVVVSAPTSAGKSLLSQYAPTLGKSTVLIFPTQELVDQQVSEIRRRPSGIIDYTPVIHLIGNSIYFDEGAKIVIGTPQSVMNYFTLQNSSYRPIRDSVLNSMLENFDSIGKEDVDNNDNIPDVRSYEILVVDEMQQANLGDEQAVSMINLMKMFTHAIQVVLSATISNVDQVVNWMKEIKGDDKVEAIVYKKRFINQEKIVYTEGTNGVGELKVVSPLSVLTVELIQSGVLNATEMQFPPQQLVSLSEAINTAETDIEVFFKTRPVTLYTCKEFEELLKNAMTSISITDPIKMQNILNKYIIPDVNITHLGIPELYSILKTLQRTGKLKAMVFVFDMVKCRETCHLLWKYMTEEEQRRYPLWYDLRQMKNDYSKQMTRSIESAASKVVKDKTGGSDTVDNIVDSTETTEALFLNNYKKAACTRIDHAKSIWLGEIKASKKSIRQHELEIDVLTAITNITDAQIYLCDDETHDALVNVRKTMLILWHKGSELSDVKQGAITALFNLASSAIPIRKALYVKEIAFIEAIVTESDLNAHAGNDFSNTLNNSFYKELCGAILISDDVVVEVVQSVIVRFRELVASYKYNVVTNEERLVIYEKEQNSILYLPKLASVNHYAPHPDYTFASLPITEDTMREVKGMLRYSKTIRKGKRFVVVEEKNEFRPDIEYKDQYMLWFERGFTIYTKNLKDLDDRFQGIAQIFLEKYGVQLLFSDISYAYGVNLPIRTVVFYNPLFSEIGLENMPVILAHQAQGRGARRGMDTRGYVVYVGVEHKQLMLGKYLNIEGCKDIDRYTGVPVLFNPLFNPSKLAKIGLYQFCKMPLSDNSEYVTNCEQVNKDAIISNIRTFRGNKATWPMQSYRLSQLTDNFNTIQQFVAYVTELEQTTLIPIGAYEFVKAISCLVFYNQRDEKDNTTVGFDRLTGEFRARMASLNQECLFGTVSDLATYIRASKVEHVSSSVLYRLKHLAEVIGIIYDNNYTTTAKWRLVARNALVVINNLVFKNTI